MILSSNFRPAIIAEKELQEHQVMSCHHHNDLVEHLEVCLDNIISEPLMIYSNLGRKWYGVNSSHHAVFCNLLQGKRGQPLVKETFRKMLNSLIESKT